MNIEEFKEQLTEAIKPLDIKVLDITYTIDYEGINKERVVIRIRQVSDTKTFRVGISHEIEDWEMFDYIIRIIFLIGRCWQAPRYSGDISYTDKDIVLKLLPDEIDKESDPEVPDFEVSPINDNVRKAYLDEEPQEPWFPIKDVTSEFVRSGLSRTAGIFVGSKEGVEYDDKVDASQYAIDAAIQILNERGNVQSIAEKTGQDKAVSRDVSDIKQLRHKTIIQNKWNKHWAKDTEPEIQSLQLSVDAGAALSRMKHEINQRAMMEEFFTRLPQAIANEQGREFLQSLKKPEDVIADVLTYSCLLDNELAKSHSRLIVQSLKKAGYIQ